MNLRNTILWLNALVIFAVAGVLVYQKEQLLDHGQTMLLRLRPVDPRSLMQGDYMDLAFAIEADVPLPAPARRGEVVVHVNESGVANFARIHQEGRSLAGGEHLLRYRYNGWRCDIGPNAFFFQEGHASRYEDACYGELRVSGSGDALLVGLRDCDFVPLGPPS